MRTETRVGLITAIECVPLNVHEEELSSQSSPLFALPASISLAHKLHLTTTTTTITTWKKQTANKVKRGINLPTTDVHTSS